MNLKQKGKIIMRVISKLLIVFFICIISLVPCYKSAVADEDKINTSPAVTYRIYFAGALFDAQQLLGNALLAKAVYKQSAGKYIPVLPQALEQRFQSLTYADAYKIIRDQDLHNVVRCDFVLANYNGTDLEPGTVIEVQTAKMLDIPVVIARSDFRKISEGPHSFNLMADYWSRTVTIVMDPMNAFQKVISKYKDRDGAGIYNNGGIQASIDAVINQFAFKVIAALDKVAKTKPVLSPEEAENAYIQFVKISAIDIQGKNQSQIIKLFLTYLNDKRKKGIAAKSQ